jgi:transposase-like protein
MSAAIEIDINILASRLGRNANTIRQWMRRSDFPAAAMPTRLGGRGKLVWTEEQAELLEPYAQERAESKGWAGYHKQAEAEAEAGAQ